MKSLKRLLSLSVLAAACGAAHALPVIDLGVATGYSGFFFGDVTGQNDVEGRLAVGGNFTGPGSIGYRNAYGSSAPSLVVGGNVTLTSNAGIFNGPTSPANTNTAIGPITDYSKATGYGVYGGALTQAKQGMDLRHTANVSSYVDFAAAKTQLTTLSNNLASLANTGTVESKYGSLVLKGTGADVEVFNLGNTALTGISLSGVKAGAHVIINSSLTNAAFSGDFGGDKQNSTDAMASHRDSILYNFTQAQTLDVSSFVNGSILAINADLNKGWGHIEGTLIAKSQSKALELGYEPFRNITAVPEPETYALMMAGLLTVVMVSRRRKAQQN